MHVRLGEREVALSRDYHDVLDRVEELKTARDQTLPDMMRTAMMMDGGRRAVEAMLGSYADKDKMRDLPIANYMRDASEAFAERLGAIPDLRVDPPQSSSSERGSERRQKAAEKRAMIVSAYDADHNDSLNERIPMLARWVPGAGYAVFTVDPVQAYGFPYPRATLHSPLDTMLAQWSSVRPPEDVGFVTKVPVRELIHHYPEHADKLQSLQESRGAGGAIHLDRHRDGLGVEVVSYYDRHGTWHLVPDKALLLDFVPNPLESGPSFVAFAKFNYNRLRGVYDDMIGPMISMARLHILNEIATRKDVAQPTNIFGGEPISGQYKQGFTSTNIFDANARVEIPSGSAQFQAWQQLDRLERTLRLEGNSPVQDSGESPMSFVTGRGMNALVERVNRSVGEFQRIFKARLQELDSKRLEYDEMSWPDITKPMRGVRQGAQFEETYTPATHIKGRHDTRREYGAMAAVDEAVKMNGLMLMDNARWVSKKWIRSQLDNLGLPESQLEEQINAEDATQLLDQWAMQHAMEPQSPEHLRALRYIRTKLPVGDQRDLIDELLASAEEAEAEHEAMAQQQQGPPPSEQDVMAALAGGGGPPGGGGPTTLARLTQGGEAQGGSQVISGGGG